MPHFPLVAVPGGFYNADMRVFTLLPTRRLVSATPLLLAFLAASCGDEGGDSRRHDAQAAPGETATEERSVSPEAASAPAAEAASPAPAGETNGTDDREQPGNATSEAPSNGEPETLDARAQYQRALEWAKKAADGSANAFDEAVKWTEKAAANGYREAQMTLAGLYFYGHEHMPRDAAKAKRWFEEAARQGSAEARYYLGMLYALGEGVEKSLERAKEEWKIAAEEGIAEAQYQLGLISIDHEETLQEGLEWLRKAADHAQVDAALALGKIYARGRYSLGPDMREAARWYRRAAEEGNPQAQYVYSLMCLTGSGVARDDKQGMSWLQLAAGRDYLPAVKKLAECYRKGEGTEANPQLAQVWELRAAEIEAAQNADKQGSM